MKLCHFVMPQTSLGGSLGPEKHFVLDNTSQGIPKAGKVEVSTSSNREQWKPMKCQSKRNGCSNYGPIQRPVCADQFGTSPWASQLYNPGVWLPENTGVKCICISNTGWQNLNDSGSWKTASVWITVVPRWQTTNVKTNSSRGWQNADENNDSKVDARTPKRDWQWGGTPVYANK